MPIKRESISIRSSSIYPNDPDILSTIAGAPNIKINPIVTETSNSQGARPRTHATPTQKTAIVAMIRAHVDVNSVIKALRKFVPESKRAFWAKAYSGKRRTIAVNTKSPLWIRIFLLVDIGISHHFPDEDISPS